MDENISVAHVEGVLVCTDFEKKKISENLSLLIGTYSVAK